MAVKNLQLLILSAIIVGIAFFGYIEIKKLNKKIDSMESKYEKLLLEEVQDATQKKKYLQQMIRNNQSSGNNSVNEDNIQSILLQYAKAQKPSQQSYQSLQTQSNTSTNEQEDELSEEVLFSSIEEDATNESITTPPSTSL